MWFWVICAGIIVCLGLALFLKIQVHNFRQTYLILCSETADTIIRDEMTLEKADEYRRDKIHRFLTTLKSSAYHPFLIRYCMDALDTEIDNDTSGPIEDFLRKYSDFELEDATIVGNYGDLGKFYATEEYAEATRNFQKRLERSPKVQVLEETEPRYYEPEKTRKGE